MPGIQAALAERIAAVMQALRQIDFYKRPDVAESVDWSRALPGLGIDELRAETLEDTAGVIFQYYNDIVCLHAIGADPIPRGGTGCRVCRRQETSPEKDPPLRAPDPIRCSPAHLN